MDADKAMRHIGHKIEIATYGRPIVNVAVECIDCYEVIVDTDVPVEEYPDRTARMNGPIEIGDRCPWCGDIVEGPNHTRSHD